MSLDNFDSGTSDLNRHHGTGPEHRMSENGVCSNDVLSGSWPDWTKRIGNAVRAVFKTMNTGLKASHDYRKFAARLPSQQACKMVFQKYFSR